MSSKGIFLDLSGENIGKECLCPAGQCIRNYPHGSVCRKLNEAHKESTGEYITPPRAGKQAAAEPRPTLYCTFCGKSDEEVERLITAPNVVKLHDETNVYICDGCVVAAYGIVHQETVDAAANR